jgi:SET domain-containing protein
VIREDLALFPLTVGPSRIHRFGVFAGAPIPAGADVIEYVGERVGRRHWKERNAARSYMLRINRYWCLDGSVGGGGAELINHCCEPNCRFSHRGDRVWVVSLRAIEPGEELVIDYRFAKALIGTPCHCGAPSCRGTINVR